MRIINIIERVSFLMMTFGVGFTFSSMIIARSDTWMISLPITLLATTSYVACIGGKLSAILGFFKAISESKKEDE